MINFKSYNSSIQTSNSSSVVKCSPSFQSYNSSIQTWVIGLFRTDGSEINLSTMSMFFSFDIDSVRIFLFSGSIATQSQTYSEPTLSNVSSTMYSDILLLFNDIFRDDIFRDDTFVSNSILLHGFV